MNKFLRCVLTFALCMCTLFVFGCDNLEVPDNDGGVCECNIVGEIAVTESGLDFSEVTVTMKASEIFENEKEYTIAVFIGSVELSVFNIITYTETDMEFIGKSVNIPTLPEGEHTLSMYFVLKTSAGYREIETVMPTFDSFDVFDKQIDDDDGYYTYAFFQEDGLFKITVEYIANPPLDDTDKKDEVIELPPLTI